uniref:Transposase, MuDR, MULE transposase domain protein n=1 Tax=Tanacetum cinerariifolium TaxID=118510 RepID=A0A6L2N7K6_TANCI|nr:transposase, MuDR, MULE transposase domain protein [Tanacetum cinerariifolium]
MNRGSILHDDLTYTMLYEMVMRKFNLEANYLLNLSAKLSPIDDNFDITDDHERRSRAHYPLVRYNYLTSNSVESVNACTVVYRKLPVIKLAETYRAMMQDWYYKRCKLAENVRSNVLVKLQEALDEEAILKEQILTLMHRFADRFTDCRVNINNLMVLHDNLLIDYGKYALGCMTGADMKKCVYLKSVRDELLRSMEEKRQLMTNY